MAAVSVAAVVVVDVGDLIESNDSTSPNVKYPSYPPFSSSPPFPLSSFLFLISDIADMIVVVGVVIGVEFGEVVGFGLVVYLLFVVVVGSCDDSFSYFKFISIAAMVLVIHHHHNRLVLNL